MEYNETRRPLWLPLLVLLPPLLPLFWTYHVQFHDEDLTFGYNTSYCSKTIKRANIDQIEACQINGLSDWGGWGIRHSWIQNGWGYIAENGPGIKLFDRESNQFYTFNCENPTQLIGLLNGRGLESE
jgi:hypothetical protein